MSINFAEKQLEGRGEHRNGPLWWVTLLRGTLLGGCAEAP